MDVEVNYLAVFLAALSTMVVGSIWYSKSVFGEKWAKLAGVDMSDMAGAKKMVWVMGSVFVASLVTAYVLAHIMFLSHATLDNTWMVAGLGTAFWAWLGFTAARLYTHDAFEGRRKKLTILNAAHELVTFLVMGAILGAMAV